MSNFVIFCSEESLAKCDKLRAEVKKARGARKGGEEGGRSCASVVKSGEQKCRGGNDSVLF